MKKAKMFKVFLICLSLIIVFAPMATFADEAQDEECNLWVGGVAVTDEGPVTGEGIEGQVTWDEDNCVLTLDNASISGVNTIEKETGTTRSNIYFNDIPLTIKVIGDSWIGGSDTACVIDANNLLTITGKGDLDIEGTDLGIHSYSNIMFDSANVNICTPKEGRTGVVTYGNVVIDDSVISVEAERGSALTTLGTKSGNIMIYGSEVTATSMDHETIICNNGDLSVIDSKLSARATYSSDKKYNMNAIYVADGRVRISNSSVKAYTESNIDDNAAILAYDLISINGSDIITPAKGTIGLNTSEYWYSVLDQQGNLAKEVLINPKKLPNTMVAKGKTVKIKSKTKALKKAKYIAKSKAYMIFNPNGKITYKKVKANKSAGKFAVNTKTGKITVKKGIKRGTYKLTVKVTDPGNKTHYGASKNVIVTIRITK